MFEGNLVVLKQHFANRDWFGCSVYKLVKEFFPAQRPGKGRAKGLGAVYRGPRKASVGILYIS